MPRNEKTSKKVATQAAKVLRDPKASKVSKMLAGSVLTQAPDKKDKASASVFAIRCFANGRRRFTDKLTKAEAREFLTAAKHLASYLRREYGVS